MKEKGFFLLTCKPPRFVSLRIYKYLFFILCVFSSCSKPQVSKDPLNKTEREVLHNLFSYLLFDHHAAFVLFGSKPMVEVVLQPPMDEESEKRLYESLRKKMEVKIIRPPYDVYECWKTLGKCLGRIKIQNYVFAERRLKNCPGAFAIYTINKNNMAHVIREYYDHFKRVYGQDFDPVEELKNLTSLDSDFWDVVLEDQFALGLLFGFGETNASAFTKMLQDRAVPPDFEFSTTEKVELFQASQECFTIPMYRSFPADPTLQNYRKEKREIEGVYRGRDLLDVTLKKLAE
jgi:hypothetical protein